ncbi:hypothetical protein D3C87_1899340 [compost metagenome]
MLVGRRFGGVPITDCPSMRISPVLGVSNPAIERSSVVLPQPDGPSSEKNSPAAMSSETSSSAL